ncbi:phosphatase PAP2 family protein [Halorubrum sp. DTA98]|uniref:phosphatase PAP2 family protein n=1 Tax=Halorubrum sp. DTA98 TaxID=3402163 RepID=UPI003AAC3742
MDGLSLTARGVGEFAVVEHLPDAVVVFFAAVTQLADVWFLFALLAAVYWFGDDRLAENPRRAGAVAIALVTCALAAVTLGKAAIAVPRPPTTPAVPTWLPGLLAEWFAGEIESDGFGFPSGHATGAIVAYGAFALLLDRVAAPRRRLIGAAVVVGAVAVSRVVIRVHYLADIVVGAVLGVTVLAVGLWLAGDERLRPDRTGRPIDPVPVFLLAAVLAAAAVAAAVVGGHAEEVVSGGIGVGTAIGGAIGWRTLRGDEPPVPGRIAVPTLAVAGGIWIAVFVVEPAFPIAVVLTALTAAAVIAAPGLARRLATDGRPSVS